MNTDLPIRKTTRIEGYDYSTPGAYFVTVCCQNRKRYFDFAPAKAMVEGVWRVIPDRFPNAEIDVFVVMPDHFHGIIILKPNMIHPVGEALVASRIYGTDHDKNDPPVGEALVASRERGTNSNENDNPATREYGRDSTENDPPVGEALVASRIAEKETLADVEKREGTSPSPTKVNKTAGLTEIIGAFKSTTTWKYSLGVKDNGWPKYTKKIWQRSFYDHVIRNDEDLRVLRDYILNNPMELSIENYK